MNLSTNQAFKKQNQIKKKNKGEVRPIQSIKFIMIFFIKKIKNKFIINSILKNKITLH